MNEIVYFCCGNLPSEGHTRECLEINDHDDLRVGEVVALDGRYVRICGMPDGVTICRDYRKRVAVRNFATNRLSYIPEWRLFKAHRQVPEISADREYFRSGTRYPGQ